MIASYGLMDDEEIELDLAALELSALDHAGIDLATYTDLLRQIGVRLAEAGSAATTSVEQAEALAHVMAGEFCFAGDVDSYDAPLNADLVRVLDRRRGLPVSLSIIYVSAARRLGWTADALNTPGHVLVRVGSEAPVIIDPFNAGRIVGEDQLIALLHSVMGDGSGRAASPIAPMTNRTVLVRLLLNQGSRAEQAGDFSRALTISDRMTAVAPDNPDAWWQRARLQLQAGSTDAARQSLSAMLEVTRDPALRELATSTLDAIASH